jgi:hypothetical protein
MKSRISAGLLGATIAVTVMLLLSQFSPREAHAAAGGEQYKVISLSSKQQLEQELNGLGAQGWKVRTGVASVVILSK